MINKLHIIFLENNEINFSFCKKFIYAIRETFYDESVDNI